MATMVPLSRRQRMMLVRIRLGRLYMLPVVRGLQCRFLAKRSRNPWSGRNRARLLVCKSHRSIRKLFCRCWLPRERQRRAGWHLKNELPHNEVRECVVKVKTAATVLARRPSAVRRAVMVVLL